VNLYKIVGLVGVVLAVVAAFVAIPYTPLALAVIGVVVGWNIAGEHHVRVIASAIALHMVSGAFDTLPVAGPMLTAILGNFGSMVAGATLLIIVRNMYVRFKA
jgi:hypothetical protein